MFVLGFVVLIVNLNIIQKNRVKKTLKVIKVVVLIKIFITVDLNFFNVFDVITFDLKQVFSLYNIFDYVILIDIVEMKENLVDLYKINCNKDEDGSNVIIINLVVLIDNICLRDIQDYIGNNMVSYYNNFQKEIIEKDCKDVLDNKDEPYFIPIVLAYYLFGVVVVILVSVIHNFVLVFIVDFLEHLMVNYVEGFDVHVVINSNFFVGKI